MWRTQCCTTEGVATAGDHQIAARMRRTRRLWVDAAAVAAVEILGRREGKGASFRVFYGWEKGIRQIKKYRRWEGCGGLLWTWVVINYGGFLCGHRCFRPQEIYGGHPCRHVSGCPCHRFKENHKLCLVIKCAKKIFYMYIWRITHHDRYSGRMGVGGRIRGMWKNQRLDEY
jgi:hypothetical protein